MSRKRKRKKSELKARAANIQQLRAKEQHVFMKLGAKLRAYFFTGILVTAPVSITFYMAYKIILWIDAGVGRLLPPQLKSYYDDLPFTIPGLGRDRPHRFDDSDRYVCRRVCRQLFCPPRRLDGQKDAGHFQRLLFAETGV